MDQHVNAQYVYVSGLDGGTYQVKYLAEDGIARDYSTNGGSGWAEGVTVVVQDVHPEVLQVVLSGLGGSAAPKLTVRGESRSITR